MQLASMKEELGRMNQENQRLRGMITQVTTSYEALQMHLAAQKQQHQQRQADVVAPRQLHDIVGGADAAEQQSNSSSSTGNKLEERGESPSTAGWLSEGRQQQQASKAHEQAQEATMRKARVSVRARSEAPIVIIYTASSLLDKNKQLFIICIYIYEY
jgi:hypothetical protein